MRRVAVQEKCLKKQGQEPMAKKENKNDHKKNLKPGIKSLQK